MTTIGVAIGVNVGAIEKELAALWREASREKQVTRACSWNLVVHTHDDAVYALYKPAVDEAVRHVPSRTLVLKPRPLAAVTREHAEIEAWVSANCQIAPGGGKLLCTEEITVEARGTEGQQHLPGLIRALNVPDVPTALWWAGAPPTDPSALRILVAGVDRLIFDTTCFAASDAANGGLNKLAHVAGFLEGMALADLGWLRTGVLRSLLASIFDAVGVEPLAHLVRVSVRCTARSVPVAKLLVGWLAARLKWGDAERVERGAQEWRAGTRGGDPIRIGIDATAPSGVRDSGVAAIVLETTRGERFSLSADADGVRIEGAGAVRTAPAHPLPLDQLLVGALGARGRDRLYPAALHRAVELDR